MRKGGNRPRRKKDRAIYIKRGGESQLITFAREKGTPQFVMKRSTTEQKKKGSTSFEAAGRRGNLDTSDQDS